MKANVTLLGAGVGQGVEKTYDIVQHYITLYTLLALDLCTHTYIYI